MKYYPLGTVLTLIGGERPVMIYGRKQIQSQTNTIWDYVACLFPEGNISDEYNIFFMDEEVETIHFMGFEGEHEGKIQELLNK